MLPFAESHWNDSRVFQQDNASIHSARLTNIGFVSKKLDVIDRPAPIPDLNPIGNAGRVLLRLLYCDLRQFTTMQELKEWILHIWSQLDPPQHKI